MLERNYSRLRILRFGCGILIQVRTNGLIITSEDKTTSIYKIRLNGISTGYTKGEEKSGEGEKKERKREKKESEKGRMAIIEQKVEHESEEEERRGRG